MIRPTSSNALAPEVSQPRENARLRMSLVDLRCVYSDTEDVEVNRRNVRANLDRHLYFVDKLSAEGSEFVGFPELSLNGYHFSSNMTYLSRTGPEVQILQCKAREKKVYISAGLAEEDEAGHRWNTQIVLGPDGTLVGWHHKLWLTKELGYVEAGTNYNVFPVKGSKMGILTCADGSDFNNLKSLVDQGAKIIYGPHANTNAGTNFSWYQFRSAWGGKWDGTYTLYSTGEPGQKAKMPTNGWIGLLKVHAALHNHAGLYNPEYAPPEGENANIGFSSGAWFIGPDGKTLGQMPISNLKNDSQEYVLTCDVPLK